MRIGYIVQGTLDVAVAKGLARRWCPSAALLKPRFRGESKETLRREMPSQIRYLLNHEHADVVIVLTDSDEAPWREVRKRETGRIPLEIRGLDTVVLGVAERNIGCWVALDRECLAKELGCQGEEIPEEDPSSFVENRFGLGERDAGREEGSRKVADFVAFASMRIWIEGSKSFEQFYEDVRDLSQRRGCDIPDERAPAVH